MGFIENQVGLAEQAAKANAYDQAKATADAQAMAQFYTQYGAQLGAQEVLKNVPLYAGDVKDSAFNRYNYGADYRQQAPVQIPAGASTNGARVQFDTPASSAPVDAHLKQKEAWRQAQSKGQ